MSGRPSSLRLLAISVGLISVLGGAFAAGRSTVAMPGEPDPVRLERGLPLGVVESPGGALAAADNYVATGISASLEPNQLRQFANEVVEPGALDAFVSSSQSSSDAAGPPVGARVLGSVVAHRLERYGRATADVSEWALGAYWDGGASPTQYWSLVDVSLRWSGDRWRVTSARETLPGPVPQLIGGDQAGGSSATWDQVLAGMSTPYFGDH